MKSSRLFAMATLIGLLALPSSADVVVSNVAEPVRDFNVLNRLDWATQGFTTNAQPYQLTEIRAIVGGGAGTPGAFAELRTSTPTGAIDTSPTGLITTFSIPDLSGARSVQSFIPGDPIVLAGSTHYFFVLGATGDGVYEWSYAEGNGQVGPGSFASYAYTFDGGTTWSSVGSDNPFHLEVNGATADSSILVSNLAEPVRDFNTIDSLLWADQSFETDAQTYQLSEIQAFVGAESGSSGAFAELRASTPTGQMDTSPAGLIATLSLPNLSGPRAIRSFTPLSPVALAPSTRYHFTLGATGPGSFEWSYAQGNGQIGVGVLTDYQYTFDGGSLWTAFGNENPFHTEVRVVPEPAMGTLLIVGTLAHALRQRRRAQMTSRALR